MSSKCRSAPRRLPTKRSETTDVRSKTVTNASDNRAGGTGSRCSSRSSFQCRVQTCSCSAPRSCTYVSRPSGQMDLSRARTDNHARTRNVHGTTSDTTRWGTGLACTIRSRAHGAARDDVTIKTSPDSEEPANRTGVSARATAVATKTKTTAL